MSMDPSPQRPETEDSVLATLTGGFMTSTTQIRDLSFAQALDLTLRVARLYPDVMQAYSDQTRLLANPGNWRHKIGQEIHTGATCLYWDLLARQQELLDQAQKSRTKG